MLAKLRTPLVAFTGALLVSCSGGDVESPRENAPITTAGGTVAKPDGSAILSVPANALAQTTAIVLSAASSYPELATLAPGTPLTIEPTTVAFKKEATLSIRYDVSTLPAAVNESGLQLHYQSGSAWWPVDGSVVNKTTKMVSGAVTRGGTYALLETPVHHIVLTGFIKDQALYVGESNVLTATSYYIYGAVALRTSNWRSSDLTRATVEPTGRVTGVSPGSVVITAFGGGQTVSTTIEILPRPIADWSQASEWTTFQGTETHSGYVPVTIDPPVFKEYWITRPIPSASAVHPVVEKDGLVFASSQFYGGGTGYVVGIDGSSGQVRWSQPLPQSGYGTMPVAVGNGGVYLQTIGPPGYFRSFDATSGSPRFAVPYVTQWSIFRAPVVIGSTVFMGCGYQDAICAQRTSDGSTVWSAGGTYMEGWTATVGDGLVYLDEGEKIGVFRASDGGLVFEMPNPYDAGGRITESALALGSDNDLLSIRAWRFYAFDLVRKQALWRVDGNFTGSVTVGNGVAYATSETRLEAHSEADGSLLWSWAPTEGPPVGSTILTKNLLFVSSAEATYAIDVASHRTVWSYPAGGGQISLGKAGTLFIALNGSLVAIRLK